MPTHDFECSQGHRFELFEQLFKNMPKKPGCPACGKPSKLIFVGKWNGIHNDHSSQYGKWQPWCDQVVRNYSHKRQLMKEFDVIEANDPVGGSRSYHKTEQKPSAPLPDAEWTDSPPDVIEGD